MSLQANDAQFNESFPLKSELREPLNQKDFLRTGEGTFEVEHDNNPYQREEWTRAQDDLSQNAFLDTVSTTMSLFSPPVKSKSFVTSFEYFTF